MVRKLHKVKARDESHYLANRAKRMRLDTAKGKIIKCTRCHDEPVKTTEFSLSDTYIDDKGDRVHTKAHYCHRCRAIAFRTKERADNEQRKNKEGSEKQFVDREALTDKQKIARENELKEYEENLKGQGIEESVVAARVKEIEIEEKRKDDEWKREQAKIKMAEAADKALWVRQNKKQILTPLIQSKKIKQGQSRENKDKKIGQARVQEI